MPMNHLQFSKLWHLRKKLWVQVVATFSIAAVTLSFIASITTIGADIMTMIFTWPQIRSPVPTPIPAVSDSPITCQNSEEGIYVVSWSPNGKYIASGRANGQVSIVGASNLPKALWALAGNDCPIIELSWDSGNKALNITYIYTSESTHLPHTGVVRWYFEAERVEHISGIVPPLSGKKCSPDGMMVAFREFEFAPLTVRNDSQDECTASAGNYPFVSTIGTPSWSPDSRYVALGSSDGKVVIKGIHEAAPVIKDHGNPVLTTSWSPDARQLVSGASDGTLKLWSVSAK